MAPKHRAYWSKKYPNMDPTKYGKINWTYIGRARKRLNQKENIQIMQLMNGWLNVGRQKGHYGQDSNCPCCDNAEESHLHLYQCTNPTAATLQADAYKSLEKYYHVHKVPPGISMPLISLLKSTSNSTTTIHQTTPSTETQTAVRQQQALGPDLLMKGYLVTDWIKAIQTHTTKDVDKIMTHLLLGIWKALFKPIWAHCNNTLHDDNNVVTQRYNTSLTNDLLKWKQNAHNLLQHTQKELINYTDEEIHRWNIPIKQITLSVLTDAHNAHKKFTHDNKVKEQIALKTYLLNTPAEAMVMITVVISNYELWLMLLRQQGFHVAHVL